MQKKLNACPKCQQPLSEPYERAYLEDKYYEFYACEACGREFSQVYRFSHVEMEEDEEAE